MALPTMSIYVDNVPATEIAPHSPPVYETWADGGCGSLTWDFAMSSKRSHHLLVPGAHVSARVGMRPVFSGRLSEPDRSTWECIAYGHAAHARKLPAFDGTGSTTRDVAVATANARTVYGWGGLDPAGIITGTVPGDDSGPTMLGDLLDQWASDVGQRWGVDARGLIYRRGDPTAPTLYLSPDLAALGQTEEGMASHLAGRFVNVGGTHSTTTRPADLSNVTSLETVDLTERGVLTLAEANDALDGLLALGKTRPAWTSGMTVHRTQLQRNGVHPFLPTIIAGLEMVRLFGIPAAFSAGTTTDVAIGLTRYDAATPDVIYLEPVKTAPRDLRSVTAAA